MMGRALACLALLLACAAARADTPIALFQSFAGNVNFTGTQKTMRTRTNDRPCSVQDDKAEIRATLSGIPAGAAVLSAHLYWAGSSATPDYHVTFQGKSYSAPAYRQYTSATGGSSYYFGGAVDVTPVVAARRNNSYSFKNLKINNGEPYCRVEGVVGGFSLLVIYSLPSEPFRVLNLYEGFRYIHNSAITLTLDNFLIPALGKNTTGRLGHITWEGDATLQQQGEDLLFNDVRMIDSINPAGNQFNSKSNINGDPSSYGIDFDAYTLGATAIQAGQTSATTRYQSGQDLVLLNAEIIAMPNAPTADLQVTLARNTPLVAAQEANYSVTVLNRGPHAETRIDVTSKLSAGLAYLSATGTGWSCSAAGQTVTCTYSGSLEVNARAPLLTLNVRVTAGGAQTNSVSVEGALFDNVSSNNSASNTATASGAVEPPWAFTVGPCTSGVAFGSSGQCARLGGQGYPAGNTLPVYVTALAKGVPTALQASGSKDVGFLFALTCTNPAAHAGVQAQVKTVLLKLCASNGAQPSLWSDPVTLTFAAKAASAELRFKYGDVGKVRLHLKESAAGSSVSSDPFVSQPAALKISSYNGGATLPPRAGQQFALAVTSYNADNGVTPNFGKEVDDGDEDARLALALDCTGLRALLEGAKCPALDGVFETAAAGVRGGTHFSWIEAGTFSLTPVIEDYLLSGKVTGTPRNDLGWFYPDHFETVIADPAMPCRPRMNCEEGHSALYSNQPFTVRVAPKNAGGKEVENYRAQQRAEIRLTAHGRDAAAEALLPARGALASATIARQDVEQFDGIAGRPHFVLAKRFDGSKPRALDWTAPTTIYLRATATETVDVGGKAEPITISSVGHNEDGASIVNGRLRVPEVHGGELHPLALPLVAQYWAAASAGLPAAWETNSRDSHSMVDRGGIKFTSCTRGLATAAAGPDNCKSVLGLAASAPVGDIMKDGAVRFRLKAPGAGHNGRAAVQFNNPPWLPSTIGHVTFGLSNSPIIYMREMY